MTNFAAFIGEPLNFKNKIKVYPPKVKDILTNPKFGLYAQILTLTQEDLQEELRKTGKEMESYPTPLEFLLANCYHSKEVQTLVQEAFLFFCREEVFFCFEEKQLNICGVLLGEEEYFDFQNIVRNSMGDKTVDRPEPIDPDEDPRIRRIKEKARERDRIKARQKNGSGITLETCLTAICCMGIGITPLNIGEMSYAAVGPIMRVMQTKEKYDIDIRSLLAGADSKKVKPKYWIRNIND